MNVNELMALIRTEMTGDPEKDIKHLQDMAHDLRREENANELLSAIADYAFNMMPENAKETMKETTFVEGKRMDRVFGEVRTLVNAGNCAEAEPKLRAISDKIREQFEDKEPKWFSFRNPFEYHMYRFLYPEDTVFERAPFDFAHYLALYSYVLVELGQVPAAETAVRRAIKFNPVAADIRFELAEICKFAHNQEQLLRVNQETLPLCTDGASIARVLANMGFYCYVAQEFADAATFYFESLRFQKNQAVDFELQDVLKRMKTFGIKFAPPTRGQTLDTYDKYGLPVPPNDALVNLALTLADNARNYGRLDLESHFLHTAYTMTNNVEILERLERVAAEMKAERENQ